MRAGTGSEETQAAAVSAVGTGARLSFSPQQEVALVVHFDGTVNVMAVNNGSVVNWPWTLPTTELPKGGVRLSVPDAVTRRFTA